MIAKTVTGSDFMGALAYGAGLRSDRINKQAELLSVANVGSLDASGIAAEMRDVASMSSRIAQPVWHTVLSWAPGEQVDRAQKIRAAALYCQLIGADLERHQIAVYEHRDTEHPHIHIYINRVPLDGGPALRTDHNYARNVVATRKIRALLSLPELPTHRQTMRDLDPHKQGARDHVHQVLTTALANPAIRSLDHLLAHLREKKIAATLKRDAKGLLVGTSFRYQECNVKGTDVGIRAKQLRDHFSSYGREALRTADPVLPSAATGLAAAAAGAGQAGSLLNLEEWQAEDAGVDDAERNENEGRRRRRPRHR